MSCFAEMFVVVSGVLAVVGGLYLLYLSYAAYQPDASYSSFFFLIFQRNNNFINSAFGMDGNIVYMYQLTGTVLLVTLSGGLKSFLC